MRLGLPHRFRLLPPSYGATDLRYDLVAGLTTAVLLVPQAMAYALLAGLPPVVGLYASVVPPLVYALTGSSRELAVGPVAIDSLLTAATVGTIAQSGSDRYLELATLLALMVGCIQWVLGILRGGFLANFLSDPVINGFTSAAALIIGVSQLQLVLGVDIPRSTSVFTVLPALTQHLSSIHMPTSLLAVASMAVLLILKRRAPRFPRALLVVVAGAIASALGLSGMGVNIVGAVPAGFPSFSMAPMNVSIVTHLLPGATTIAFVAFMESISVSTKLGTMTGHRVDPNRELLALGLSNAAAGLFGGYPVAGGLTRTAVNAAAGARSKLAGLVTAVAVGTIITWCTDWLFHIPKAVLGAVILTAITGLFDVSEPRRLWFVKRADFVMLAITFWSTLILGVQQGIGVGVCVSLLAIVVRTTRPHVAVLGRLPNSRTYRNIKRFAEAQEHPGIVILRIDAPFHFGNTKFLRRTLVELERDRPEPIMAIVLEASGINQIDSSAETVLREITAGYRERGVDFILVGAKGPVRDVLDRSGFTAELGPEGFAHEVHEAVAFIEAKHGKRVGFEDHHGPLVGIPNERHLSSHLAVGGQPTHDALVRAKELGFTTVITLCCPGEKTHGDEQRSVSSLGMRFFSLPVADESDLTVSKAWALHGILQGAGGGRTLLHCRSGNRVGALLALHAFHVRKRTRQDALLLGRRAGLTSSESHVRHHMAVAPPNGEPVDNKS